MAKDESRKTVTKVINNYDIKESLNLQINKYSADRVSPQNINVPIKLALEGVGTGKLKYRFVAYSGTYKEVIQDFSDNNEVQWIPSKAGTYNLYFVIKDDVGKTVTKSITNYIINDNKLQINSFGTDKLSPQKVGSKIQLTTKAQGNREIKYRFVAILDGSSEVIQDFNSNNTVTWTPKKSGKYNIYFVAKDSLGERVQKAIYGYEIQEDLTISSANVSLLSPQELGSKINLTTIAKGNGALEYRFVAVLGDNKEIINDYSSNNSVTWTPTKAGIYNLYFVVKDSTGRSINQVLKYEVVNPISIKNLSTSKTSPQEIGTEININAEVVGDGKTLYRFSYKKDSQVVYLSDFTESNKISWVPNVKGNYTIIAEAKGSTQKIVKKEIPFEIKEAVVDRERIILENSIEAKTIIKPIEIWLNDINISSLIEYKLQYSEKDKNNFTTISEGTNLSNNSLLGVFDTTLLQNGLYDIKLIGVDNKGNKVEKNAVYIVTGNLKAGNFKFSNEDLNIPLDGLPISIVRNYNSAQNYSGDFGNGFSLSLTNLKLEVTDDIGETGWEQIKTGRNVLEFEYEIRETKKHKVTITYPDGETEEFGVKLNPQKQKYQPIQYTEMSFEAKSGSKSQLKSLDNIEFNVFGGYLLSDEFGYSPSNFELTDKNGIKYIINKKTGVNKVIYLDGETVTINNNEIVYKSSDNTTTKTVKFQRDSKNRITSVKDFDNKTINYVYDDKGNLVSVVDRQGLETKYIYDANNKLVQIKNPYKEIPARYEYDNNGRLVAYIDEYGIRTEYIFKEGTKEYIVKDAAGNLEIYEYDDNGNVVAYTDKENNKTYFEYNISNKLIKETDPLGNTFKYNYDEYGNLLSKEDPYGNKVEGTYNEYGEALTIKDSNNNILVSNTYGNGGILTEIKDVNNQSVNIEYNSNDKPIKFTNQLGKVVQVAYDSNNNPISYKDEMGNITKFTFDDNGNCLSKSIEVTINGKKEIITVSYEYDSKGNIVKATDSKGNISLYEYSKNTNELTKVTDKKGNITKYQYDAKGNLAKIIYPDNTEENMFYDKMKNVTSVIDENGKTTYFKYDKMSKITEIKYPNGLLIKYSYDAKGNLIKISDSVGKETKYLYDALSRNTEIIDSLNNKTSFKYDKSSNLTKIIYSNGNIVSYEYDKLGRNTKITYGDNLSKAYIYDAIGRITEAVNEEGNSTYYKYDDCSNLIKVIDPLGNSTSYQYNEAGLLTKEIDSNLNATEYKYDTLGRLVERKLPLGQKESYDYDNNGNLSKRTDFNGKVTLFEYNSMNQLVKKTLADGSNTNYYYSNGALKEVKDNTGSILYEYDQMGNLKKQTNANGETIEYTYDLYGNKATVKTENSNISYGYDKIGRLIWTKDKRGIQTTYEYDNVGNLIKENKGNGTYTTYKYNSANRLIKLENKKSNGEIISSYEYTYNKLGFRTSVKDNIGKITTYVYDKNGNLLSEASNGTTVNYQYDKVYNRIKKITGTEVINYSYDKNNRLIKEGDINYTYDNNGNLTKKENTKIK